MKTHVPANLSPRRRSRGVTLVEMMITMVTTVVILGGAMAAYIYGLKMMQFTQPKLSASDEARRALSLLTEEIRSAYDAEVGNRTNGVFVHMPPSTRQAGNAVRIFPTSGTNYILYFSDTNDFTLKRTTNNTEFTVIVNAVTNEIAFTAEDFKGTYLSNDVDNFVIGLTLQIYQLNYPKMPVAAGQFFDWYQLRTKVTRRNLF